MAVSGFFPIRRMLLLKNGFVRDDRKMGLSAMTGSDGFEMMGSDGMTGSDGVELMGSDGICLSCGRQWENAAGEQKKFCSRKEFPLRS